MKFLWNRQEIAEGLTSCCVCLLAVCTRRANGAVQSGKLLLAEIDPTVALHGQLAKLTKAIEEEDFRTLELEVSRVLSLINVEVTVRSYFDNSLLFEA